MWLHAGRSLRVKNREALSAVLNLTKPSEWVRGSWLRRWPYRLETRVGLCRAASRAGYATIQLGTERLPRQLTGKGKTGLGRKRERCVRHHLLPACFVYSAHSLCTWLCPPRLLSPGRSLEHEIISCHPECLALKRNFPGHCIPGLPLRTGWKATRPCGCVEGAGVLNCLGTPAVSRAGRPLAQDPAPPWEVAPHQPHPASHASSPQAVELDDYRVYPGANCRVGHGASSSVDLVWTSGRRSTSRRSTRRRSIYSPVRVTVAECKARCDFDAECTCVTYRRSDGGCWKRAGCSAAAFEYAPAPLPDGNNSSAGSVYDVYVNAARHLGEWRTPERARAQSDLARRGVDEQLCSSVQPRVSYPRKMGTLGYLVITVPQDRSQG